MSITKRISHEDLPPYTNGWFQIAWSNEINPKQVKTIKAFGQDIVLFRESNGKLNALNPFCPHLGAHLGHGGKVVSDSIRCPYHGWCFNGEGKCSSIPYTERIPEKARAKTWPIVEKYGMVFTYRNADESKKEYPLPQIDNFNLSDWSRPFQKVFKINTKMQEVMENSVDAPHFHALHGHHLPPMRHTYNEKENTIYVKHTTITKFLFKDLQTTLEYTIKEPGFHYIEFNNLPLTKAVVFSSLVPVDENHCENRLTIFIKKSNIPLLSYIYKKYIALEMIRTYSEDIEIWENKIYHKSPVLCDKDGEIIKLRKWYSKFF